MCRHLAYLGPPASLRELIIEPPHGLYRQSWAPRRQRHGTVNADGFGVGWYAGGDPLPARYRRGQPIWADPSFTDVARVTRTTAALAAVRCATAGTEAGEAAAAPYTAGPLAVQPQRGGQRLAGGGGRTGRGAARRRPACARGPIGLGPAVGARAAPAPRGRRPGRRPRRHGRPASGRTRARQVQLPAHRRRGHRGDRGRGHPVLPLPRRPRARRSEPCDDAPGWIGVPDGSVLTVDGRRASISGPLVPDERIATG